MSAVQNQHTGREKTSFYCLSTKFQEEQASIDAYFAVQEFIHYTEVENEFSVFRICVPYEEGWQVVVLGKQSSQDFTKKIEAMLSKGTQVPLPPQVLALLMKKREQAEQNDWGADWIEKHYSTK